MKMLTMTVTVDSDHMRINNDNSISDYNNNVMIMTVIY